MKAKAKRDDSVVSISGQYHGAIDQIIELDDARTTAIVGVAILDNMLERAISTCFIPLSRKFRDDLFDAKAPLASMAMKIDVGHALALYDDGVRKDLILLNRIRNRFAHKLDIHSFGHPDISKLASNLRFPKMEKHPIQRVLREMLAQTAFDEADAHHSEFLYTVLFICVGFEAVLLERSPTLTAETKFGMAY